MVGTTRLRRAKGKQQTTLLLLKWGQNLSTKPIKMNIKNKVISLKYVLFSL
jgi:hypothetical protein